MIETGVVTVFAAALVTALATGLGALPFWFTPAMNRRWLGISNAAAAGLMVAASFSLIAEGFVCGAPPHDRWHPARNRVHRVGAQGVGGAG
jgi:ZIP family zinc transporter